MLSSSNDFDTLAQGVNDEWIKRYGGERTADIRALCNRVRLLGQDRDCWVTTAKASDKARIAAEAKHAA